MNEIEIITEETEKYFKLFPGSIQIATRKTKIKEARQIAHSLGVKLLYPKKCTKSYIAQSIGNKNHATLIYGCKVVNNLIDTEKMFREDVEEIEKRIVARIEELTFNVSITEKEKTSSIIEALVSLIKNKLVEQKNVSDAFLNYLLDIYSQRDDYSSAKIIEMVREKHLNLMR